MNDLLQPGKFLDLAGLQQLAARQSAINDTLEARKRELEAAISSLRDLRDGVRVQRVTALRREADEKAIPLVNEAQEAERTARHLRRWWEPNALLRRARFSGNHDAATTAWAARLSRAPMAELLEHARDALDTAGGTGPVLADARAKLALVLAEVDSREGKAPEEIAAIRAAMPTGDAADALRTINTVSALVPAIVACWRELGSGRPDSVNRISAGLLQGAIQRDGSL